MGTKFTGYLCFYLGLAAIIASTISVYFVFTQKIPPIQTFNLPPLVIDAKTLNSLGFKNDLPEGGIELLPATVNNQFANFFAHILFMSFVGGVGYKISMLGAYFLRPIFIQVKDSPKEVTAS